MDKREKMLAQVESWKQSGLSQRSFCDQGGIKLSTFNYWVRVSKGQDDLVGDFIQISPQKTPLSKSYEIIYPNGVLVRLQSPELQELFTLVKFY